jgi:glycosyltransferase involved in cell wall biosynthesis
MGLSIAMFSDSALPVLNGVSVSIDMLIRELRAQDCSVHLYTSAHSGRPRLEPNTYRFRAIETPWTKGYPLAYPPFWRMLQTFRTHRYDLIHTHTPFTVGFVGLRWAESHGLPVVSTYHTLYDRYAHYIPFFPRRYVRFKIAKHTNWYYNRVDHVVVPSEAALKWLRRHSVDTPASVIPTGAPALRMLDRADTRLRLGMRPEERVLLYVGRLAKEKNLETLIRACALVFAEDARARLWLVGDGPYHEDCVRLVRELGIGDRVRFVGFVPREEVDPFYAAADLFVFASMSETQGLVVQEAGAYGLPAVVVASGGAGEAVRDGVNGLAVRNEHAELASACLRLLNDDALYAQLSENARKIVRQFGAQDMAKRMLEVYEGVLRRERREHGDRLVVP